MPTRRRRWPRSSRCRCRGLAARPRRWRGRGFHRARCRPKSPRYRPATPSRSWTALAYCTEVSRRQRPSSVRSPAAGPPSSSPPSPPASSAPSAPSAPSDPAPSPASSAPGSPPLPGPGPTRRSTPTPARRSAQPCSILASRCLPNAAGPRPAASAPRVEIRGAGAPGESNRCRTGHSRDGAAARSAQRPGASGWSDHRM